MSLNSITYTYVLHFRYINYITKNSSIIEVLNQFYHYLGNQRFC